MRWLNLKGAASVAALAAVLALPASVRGQADSGEARFACRPVDETSGIALAFAVAPTNPPDYMAMVVLTAPDGRSYSWRGIAPSRRVWDSDRRVATDIIRLALDEEGDYAELHVISSGDAGGVRFESRVRARSVLAGEDPVRLFCVMVPRESGGA